MAIVNHTFVEQTTEQTHTGDVIFTDISGAEITSGNFIAGKKYLIVANAQFGGSSIAEAFGIQTLHGSTAFAESNHVMEPTNIGSTDYQKSYTWFTVWTAIASEGIKLQFKTFGSGETVKADQITLTAIELTEFTENTDWFFDFNSTSTALTTTFTSTNNASATFTPSEASDWLVLSYDTIGTNGSDQFESRIEATGGISSTSPTTSVEGENATLDKLNDFITRIYSLTAVSHTFTQQARNFDTSEGTRTNSAIFAINLNKFKKHSFAYTEAEVAGTGGTSEIQTASITPDSTSDNWVGCFFTFNLSSSGSQTGARMQVDNVDQPPTQTSDNYFAIGGWDPSDLAPFFIQSIENLDNTAHNIDVDVFNTSTSLFYGNRLSFAVTLETPVAVNTETFTVDARLDIGENELTYRFVEQTADQSHTGDNNFADITGATIPSEFFVTGRKYLIVVTTQAVGSNINTNYSVRTLHGSTGFDGAEHVFEPNAVATRSQYSYFNVWTAVAGEGIKMQFKTMTPAQTVSADQTTLFALEISEQFIEGIDWHSDTVLASTVLNTTPSTSNNATITFTPPVAGSDWLVITEGCVDTDALNVLYTSRTARSGEATSTTPSTTQEGEDAPLDLYVQTVFRVFTLGNASNTFEQEAFKDISQGPNSTREYSSVFAINLNRFKSHSFAYTDGTITLDTTDNLATSTQVQTDTLAPATAGNTWIMGSFVTGANAFQEIRARMQVDQVDQVPTQTSDNYQQLLGYDPDDENNWAMQTVEDLDTSSHITDIDVTAETGSPSDRTVQFRNIFEVRLQSSIVTNTEDFTADAILQETIDKDFTINARLIVTFDETFTVDAILFQTVDKDFTVNAIVKLFNVEETFLVDAFVQNTFDETFTTDAILKATFSETFLIDAFLKALNTDFNFLVDGFISAENQKMFLVDGLAQATFDEDFTVNSIVVDRNTETFDVNSILIVRQTTTFIVDGLIQTQNIDKTFLIDAFVQATQTETFEVDAFVQATQTETFLVDAFVQATQTETFLVDAFIQALNQEETFLIDAFVQATFTETFTVDAITVGTKFPFTVDAFPQATFTETYLVDAFVQQLNINKDFTVNAILVEPNTETFIVDGLLEQEKTTTFILDSLLQGQNQNMFLVDGTLAGEADEEFIVDGLLEVVNTETFDTDAILLQANTETFTVDSILVVRNDETFDINGLLQDTFDEDFIVDSIIFQRIDETFLIDAELVTANTETFDLDAVLKATITEDFIVDGILFIINTEEFFVHALLAQRETFRIDAVLVRQVTTDVDAILKDTNDEGFLVDSILKQGNQEFFLVDGLLVVINSETFFVDAVLAERNTETFLVNALLQSGTGIETFLVDAGLAEIKTNDFIVNGILFGVDTDKTFTISVILKSTFDETFEIDSELMQLGMDETFEVDSQLTAFNINKTFIVDGNVQLLASIETFIVDAQLAKLAVQKDFIVDTFIQQVSDTETFFVDAVLINVIPATIDKVFTIDGVLKAFNQTETFTIRAITKIDSSTIIDVGAMLQATLTETLLVDSILVSVETETFIVDAVLIPIATIGEEFFVDAFVKATLGEAFIVDGNVALPSAKTFRVDVFLLATKTKLPTVNAILTAFNQETFLVDAQLVVIPTETFDVNAILKATFEETFLVDTFSQESQTKDFFVDSILAGVGQKPFLVNAIVKAFNQEETFDIDARLALKVDFTVDAIIFKSGDVLCSSFSTVLGEDWSVASSDPVNLQGWILINSAPPTTVLFNTPSFPNVLRMQCMGSPQNHFATKLFNRKIFNDRDFIWQFKHNHINGCTKFQTRMSTNLQEDAVLNKSPNQTTIRYRSFNGNFGEDVFIEVFDKNGVIKVTSAMIDLVDDSVVFPSIERVAGIITLNVYTDEARTAHISGSPVSVDTNGFEMNSLNAVYFGNLGASGSGRQAREEFDDIIIQGDLCPRIKIDSLLKASDQEKDFTVGAILSTPVKFTVDAFLDGGSIDVTFFVDAILEAISGERTFTVNAILVRDTDFNVDGLIKAIGDIRCQPSFLEKIFFDDLTDTSNWSSEINNTSVDGWDAQEIFIDGESIPSDGIVRATMKAGGFSGGDTPIFKTKYRRKLIGSEGGIGLVVDGAKVRLEFEYTHIAGDDGIPIGLNKTGIHPENDPNTSAFHIAGGENIALVLDSGLTSVQTGTILVGTGVKRFVVAESIGNTVTLNVYSDLAHTSHVAGSPVFVDSSTVDKNDLNFSWVLVGANPKLLAPAIPNTTVEMDEIHIYASPCPIIKLDALLVVIPEREFTVGARLVKQIKVSIDAVLRGRKDFTVNAKLSTPVKFDVDAKLAGVETEDFFINAVLKLLDSETDFFVDAQIIRGAVFSVSAIFSTEPSDPNFSLTHLQSIIHIFSGIFDKEFQIDANLSGRLSFTVDAKLVRPLSVTVNAILSTVPIPLAFSITHFQDIVPLLSIDESVTTDVNALLITLDQEETLDINARLVLKPLETFFIDAQLIQNTKTITPFVDSLLKAIIDEQTFVNSILVARNVEEPLVNAILQKFNAEEDFTINVLLKDFDKVKQPIFDALLSLPRQITTFVDAVLKLNGEDGFCNFYPDTLTIGTGLEQFVGPIQPEHESDVDLFIGQEFTLNNQQVKRARILLRSTEGITVPSTIQGKIWSNVVKGNVAGEVVEVTSINTIDADVSSGDLPTGVWTEVVFDFGGALAPFLTGDFLIGIQHAVGTGINDPTGVGVAQPVISGGNVIAGEALFRREDNSILFTTPDTWKVLISDSIDMVIDLEIVNGDDIILGRGNQCPRVDSIVVDRFTEDSIVNSILVNRKIETFTINAILLATDSEDILVNAILSPLKEFTIDAQLFVLTITNDETFIVNARLERPNQLKPFFIEAILTAGFQKPFLIDGFFKRFDKLKLFIVDVNVKAFNQEETFTINAVLLLTTQPEIFVDGLLKLFNAEETFTITGALAVTQPPVTFTIGAELNDEKERFRVDAQIVQRTDETFIVGARLTDATEKEYFVNSIIKAFNTDEDFFVDTILTVGFQEPFLIDSHLRVSNSTTPFVNAILSKDGLISEFTVNAIIIRESLFIIDGLQKALGDGILGNGNNGGTNFFANNPFITNLDSTTIQTVTVGTNLCGQRVRMPTSPVRILRFSFRLHRDGLSGSPVGSMVGKIYRNSIAGNPILPADLLETSDNTVLISTLGTNTIGTDIFFNFSTDEITPDDNIFIGIQLTGTNEEVFFSAEALGQTLEGGDFTTNAGSNWGVDQGIDAVIQVFIDDEPRQRASALVSAILGVRLHTFLIDGNVKSDNIDKEFIVDGKVVFPKSVEFTIGAILIGSIDVTIGAFVGEIQETVLDVESVVVTNNSDIGVESTIGVGDT